MKYRILILAISCLMISGTAHARIKKTAIIIPDATTSGINLSTGKSISSYAVSEFVNSGRFTVVDRKNLDRTLEELKLQMTGLTEKENAKKVGRFLNADKFVYITVSRTGGISMVDNEEKFVIKLDVNDIETGVIEASVTEMVNGINNVYAVMKKMIITVIDQIAMAAQVLSLAGDTIYLDVGSNDGIIKEKAYIIKMVTRVVKDAAGKEVFRKKETIGSVKITDVNEHSSEAQVTLSMREIKIQEGALLDLILSH